MPSTVIRSIRYEEDQELLIVEFVSGWIYHYRKVPQYIYENFRMARSKGIYFNAYVKEKFEFERVHPS